MTIEFNDESEFVNNELLGNIDGLLKKSRPLGELRSIDLQMAEVITSEEYDCFLPYKGFSLEELSAINKTPGFNGALNSAIERGFILGYWLAWQRFKVQ